ncbi:hypothetical protein GCM10011360_41840 [Primorskyibacter flagellatus]|uniref:Uncharacterized protein n=1 Tax=Primorskyibacter flagellatus TaxID=1387277 RepID=A0A917EIW2_9RHOB|nr:hypothetical protein [Primorskyibacter flagellatus]GGE50396.1 hypothetical protein GCM10011360_41840 [Primorskyibacter flagellatus]
MYDHDQLVEKLRQFLTAPTEAGQDRLAEEISANVIDPAWTDRIFYSDAHVDAEGRVNYDTLAAEILSYRAIRL